MGTTQAQESSKVQRSFQLEAEDVEGAWQQRGHRDPRHEENLVTVAGVRQRGPRGGW